MIIGVLALQGAFAKHAKALEKLNCSVVEIREPKDLIPCQGLILPGGESTVLSRLMRLNKLDIAIQKFAHKKPLFGTCAGLIVMSKSINSNQQTSPLELLDVAVDRNAYGSQVASFVDKIDLLQPSIQQIPAFFIRAPKITEVRCGVEVLGRFKNQPVIIQQKIKGVTHLGSTFHPELTNDLTVHEYFLKLCDVLV
ncbi:MAG: pyridoxal 5'-phosphate synthase glutaminase subunit PdxT [Parachlamydiales bacterium]|nr:pyridoxal 5'-phosphate synthase glutaminase subunit PdxT [Parachlamydiales bacterium]